MGDLDPSGIAVVVFFAVANLGVMLSSIYNNVRPRPPLNQQFASAKDLERVEKHMQTIEAKIETRLTLWETRFDSGMTSFRSELQSAYDKIQRSDESRSSSLHTRLNSIEKTISAMTGKAFKSTAGGRDAG